jgi:hypothetical protein
MLNKQNHILLQTTDKQVWLANCKIENRRLFAGFAYVGFCLEKQQTLYNRQNATIVVIELEPEHLDTEGSYQFNVYFPLWVYPHSVKNDELHHSA